MGPGTTTKIDPVTGYSDEAGHGRRVAVTILGMAVLGFLGYVIVSLIQDWGSTPPAREKDAKFTTGYFSTKSKPPSGLIKPGEATSLPVMEKKALHLRTGDYVRGNDRGSFLATPRSVFIWFYAFPGPSDVPLVSYSTATDDLWTLKVDRDGRLCYCAYGKDGKKVGSVRAQTTDLRDNVWHCVGFVREEDGDVRLYADGTGLLGDVEGVTVPVVPPKGSENTFLMVGAEKGKGKIMSSPDHTGVGNLTMWSHIMTPIQVSALAEPYEMVNPLQFITDRAESLLLWMPLWDTDGNNVKDVKGNLMNARMAHDVKTMPEPDDLVLGEEVRMDEENQKGVKRGALPPPVKVN